METFALVLLVVAAAAVCPGMMWWQRRRGRDPACHVPIRMLASVPASDRADLDELRRRRDKLAARIAELDDPPAEGERPVGPTAR